MSTTAGNEDAQNSDGSNGSSLLRTHLRRLQSSHTETLLLDGGTGEELFLRGVPDDRKTWSAYAITHEQYHSVVEDVHKSFIEAGSQAITTNSYGITPGVGFTDGEEVKRLVSISGEIARRAVTETSSSNPVALVLGSLGPQVESYRPDLIMKHENGVRAYRYPIEGLYPHIDLYLAETMSCFEEACQAIDALSKFYHEMLDSSKRKHPILVSFTLDSDGRIRSGELVVDVIPRLIEYAHEKKVELVGVLFNCCEPESISKVLKKIRSTPQIHCHMQHPPEPCPIKGGTPKIFLGAYANRLTPVDPDWTIESSDETQAMREDLTPEQYWKEYVKLWHGTENKKESEDTSSEVNTGIVGEIGGVQLFGGCCGIGPSHISVLKKHLAEK